MPQKLRAGVDSTTKGGQVLPGIEMSKALYIWVSMSFHPERFGQFCTVDLKPDLYRTFSSQVEVTFSDGETFKANRTHIRADSEFNRKKYVREPEGETKVCRRCKEEKDITEFDRYKKGGKLRRPDCRQCKNAYLRDWKRDRAAWRALERIRLHAPFIHDGLQWQIEKYGTDSETRRPFAVCYCENVGPIILRGEELRAILVAAGKQ